MSWATFAEIFCSNSAWNIQPAWEKKPKQNKTGKWFKYDEAVRSLQKILDWQVQNISGIWRINV